MKRRDLLRSLSMSAAGMLWTRHLTGQSDQGETKAKARLANPIRVAVRKNGQVYQPLQIQIEDTAPSGEAVIKLDGVEVDRRNLETGSQTFEVYLKAIDETSRSTVTVEINGKSLTEEIMLKPVRKMLIYVLPDSHHDLGYTDLQADVERKQIRNITQGIELAQYVKPYVKTNKNDYIDAEAIAEAVTRPTMRFVPIRSDDQLDLQSLHRVRERWVVRRTAVINQIRGLLLESGITMRKGRKHLEASLPSILEDAENKLSGALRALLTQLQIEMQDLHGQIEECDQLIVRIASELEPCRRHWSPYALNHT